MISALNLFWIIPVSASAGIFLFSLLVAGARQDEEEARRDEGRSATRCGERP
jgi:hypothetical protein